MKSKPGESVCQAAVRSGIEIEHACEMSCACTTCHVHVREGFAELPEADDLEEDYLDMAWGVDPDSRSAVRLFPATQIWWLRFPSTRLIWCLNVINAGQNGTKWSNRLC